MAPPSSGSALIAMVPPLTVLVLLLACVALRRAVRRRRSSIGPSALETFPWSWLSFCVEDRRAPPDPWGDRDDGYYYALCIAGLYAVEQRQDQDHHPKMAAAVEQDDACRGESEREQGGTDAESPPPSPTIPKPVFHLENFDFARADHDGRGALGVGSGGAARKETPPEPVSEAQHDSEKLGGSLSKPPILHLPSDIGAQGSLWELETKLL